MNIAQLFGGLIQTHERSGGIVGTGKQCAGGRLACVNQTNEMGPLLWCQLNNISLL
jgi:hypothetical protein